MDAHEKYSLDPSTTKSLIRPSFHKITQTSVELKVDGNLTIMVRRRSWTMFDWSPRWDHGNMYKVATPLDPRFRHDESLQPRNNFINLKVDTVLGKSGLTICNSISLAGAGNYFFHPRFKIILTYDDHSGPSYMQAIMQRPRQNLTTEMRFLSSGEENKMKSRNLLEVGSSRCFGFPLV